MKTAQQAAANYGTNGSSVTAQNQWAADFITQIPKMQARAAAQAAFWQSQVSTAQAQQAFIRGVQNLDVQAVTAKVNGPAKATFAAQVRAASTGKYLQFATAFIPAVSQEVANLDRTNPRGTPAQNRARLNAYLDWIESQKGNFKQ